MKFPIHQTLCTSAIIIVYAPPKLIQKLRCYRVGGVWWGGGGVKDDYLNTLYLQRSLSMLYSDKHNIRKSGVRWEEGGDDGHRTQQPTARKHRIRKWQQTDSMTSTTTRYCYCNVCDNININPATNASRTCITITQDITAFLISYLHAFFS